MTEIETLKTKIAQAGSDKDQSLEQLMEMDSHIAEVNTKIETFKKLKNDLEKQLQQ